MAIELGTAYVTLLPSTRGFSKAVGAELQGVERQAKASGRVAGDNIGDGIAAGTKGKMGAIGGVLKAGLIGAAAGAGLAVGAVFASSIGKASDLQQSRGGVQAVFKDMADGMLAESKRAATGLGLTENAFNELATTLGSGLKNKGIKDFAGQTSDLIGLGADLAAQFGGSTQDAVQAISSLMRGESDPIERYGVAINETAIKAELAATGQDKLTGAALETAKAQARLKILFKQTADAQGAFARESDTLAGKQQRASAQWEDLQAAIGERFLPVLTDAMGFVSEKLLPGLGQMGDAVTGISDLLFKGDFTGALTNAFGWSEDSPAVDFLFNVRDGIQGIADILFKGDFTGKLRDAFGWEEDNAVVDWLFTLRESFLGIRDAVLDAWENAQPIFVQVRDWLVNKWAEIAPAVDEIFGSVRSVIADVMVIVEAIIRGTTEAVLFFWDKFGADILAVLDGAVTSMVGIVQGFWKTFEGIWTTLTGFVTGDTEKMRTGVVQIFEGLATAGKGIFDGLVKALGGIWSGIKKLFADPVNWVIANVINPLARAVNDVAKALGASFRVPLVGPLLFSSGKSKGNSGAAMAFAEGGYTGPGGKFQPAGIVHAGEVVWSQADVAAHGGPMVVDAMRRMRGFAGGGIVPNAKGFAGFDPTFLAAIRAWAAATGRRWSVTGNGGVRARADQQRAYDLYRAGLGPLAARPGTSAHERGVAVDLSPRPGENSAARALLGRYGLALTVKGEPWHVGMPGARGATGGFDLLGSVLGAFLKSVPGGGMWGSILSAIPGKLIDLASGAKLFDSGGWLRPGANLAVNNTGRPEAILTADQWDNFAQVLTADQFEAGLQRILSQALREARMANPEPRRVVAL